jgi:hypothetical protein
VQKYKRPTVIFIVFWVALLTVYDVWALTKGYEFTVSSTLLQAARDWPIIPLVVGILIGHLFFPNRAAGSDPTRT